MAELMLDQVQVEARDQYGQSPLFRAAAMGHLDMIRLLIQKCAKVNARDKTQSTPLHFAIENEQGEAAVLLLELGADGSLENNESKTPEQMTRNKQVLEYILSQRAVE